MMENWWVQQTEWCSVKTMEIDLELLKETSKETSLVSSSDQWMVMQMVLMTGSDWG